MPGLSELIAQVRAVLGPNVTDRSPEAVVGELHERMQHELAIAVEREIIMRPRLRSIPMPYVYHEGSGQAYDPAGAPAPTPAWIAIDPASPGAYPPAPAIAPPRTEDAASTGAPVRYDHTRNAYIDARTGEPVGFGALLRYDPTRPPTMFDPTSVEDLAAVETQRAALRRLQTRPPAPAPRAVTTIGTPADLPEGYADLVRSLGCSTAAVDRETFKALVPRLGLHVYAQAEVIAYLHCAYKVPPGDLTDRVVWGWRPLRACDRELGAAPVPYNGRVQRWAPAYAKPIPYPVLLTVQAIVEACPSASFFVSDDMTGHAIPDPFLLVEIAGEAFTVERWDEPSFRAKATP